MINLSVAKSEGASSGCYKPQQECAATEASDSSSCRRTKSFFDLEDTDIAVTTVINMLGGNRARCEFVYQIGSLHPITSDTLVTGF